MYYYELMRLDSEGNQIRGQIEPMDLLICLQRQHADALDFPYQLVPVLLTFLSLCLLVDWTRSEVDYCEG